MTEGTEVPTRTSYDSTEGTTILSKGVRLSFSTSLVRPPFHDSHTLIDLECVMTNGFGSDVCHDSDRPTLRPQTTCKGKGFRGTREIPLKTPRSLRTETTE